jgi:flagellar biosynthesis protein FliP
MLRRFFYLFLIFFFIIQFCGSVFAEDSFLPVKVNFGIEKSNSPKDIAMVFQVMIILTLVTLAPALLTMVTCFTRIAIIFAFLRRALALGNEPSNQIIIGLSLFLTFYIMAPVWKNINDRAVTPYLNGKMPQKEALTEAVSPLREFMFKYTGKKEMALFMNIAKKAKPQTRADIPTYILIPAYIISELKTAFQIGFFLFLPFLVLDMVVASILLSMGMIVLPPVTISTPFKILLFVMVDGWYLIVQSITMGFK